MKRKWLWRTVAIIGAVLMLAAGGFVVWGSTPPAPMPEALDALQPDQQVQVEQGRWIVFQPADSQPDTGLIFYPGGRVDARAYAPAMRAIAAQGYLVVIVPMPLNLAVLAPDSAGEVIAAYPLIRHWAIGGHSLGGAMAARYAHTHPGLVEGLVLWASYPAASDDLSGAALRVVSIYGTRDGLATGDKIDASRLLLPPTTQWVAVEGGNHAQFGWYGPQQGDYEATISRLDQQAQVVEATLQLLEAIGRAADESHASLVPNESILYNICTISPLQIGA